jgi:hypothetical protein
MSDLVSTFTDAADSVTAIGALAFGALGGVVLGNFVFSGFETPDQITFGGAQQMDVKRLIGGARVIDLMGPDDRALEWAGTFIDGSPQARAQQLDQMRAAGLPLPLTWGTFFYTVLIARFDADVRYGRVPYRISCVVLRNEATAPQPAQPGLLGALTDDVNSALGVAGAAQTALTTVQADLTAVSTLVPGSSALTGIARDIGSAQNVLTGIQSTSEAAINGIAARGAALGSLVGSASDITAAASSTGTLAQGTQAAGYINRMAVNAGSGPGT